MDYMRLTIVWPSIFFLLSDIFVGLTGSSCIRANPWGISGCFSASMGQLHSNYSALRVCKVYDPLERFYVTVVPDPLDGDDHCDSESYHIFWRYAPFGHNCCSFDYDSSDTTGGKALEE
jgi:hypothetical protein